VSLSWNGLFAVFGEDAIVEVFDVKRRKRWLAKLLTRRKKVPSSPPIAAGLREFTAD